MLTGIFVFLKNKDATMFIDHNFKSTFKKIKIIFYQHVHLKKNRENISINLFGTFIFLHWKILLIKVYLETLNKIQDSWSNLASFCSFQLH